ncbi:polyhydroxyalkanoic acid system family protein [Lichenihabitans sp. Uapishka_5]|uniref:polyhydroxyalkanoic acid system family protein n=1 Tax=Lichenihabitans sp. Uapishka_5 TaxID=3037302 RepID=UPI0029E7D739|nr:polyhydroxyalkanoic acid system family protein [Lichenihabitans sp. Uapishka_5]MDX7951152.1 polyhydroxyalkanoic acid system family protein [Lichenihabitans sp. Uapishka_5]
MTKPLVVSVPHQLGRPEAIRRLKDGLQWAREKYGTVVAIQQEDWAEDHLAFRVAVLGQAAAGTMDVSDTDVTLSVQLPWLLAKFAEKAQAMLQKQGHLLLEKK